MSTREGGPMNQISPRILVVDDEVVIRRTLETLLRRQGYEVWTAADHKQAFAWQR
jgi:CheY-like chemotaxis protein